MLTKLLFRPDARIELIQVLSSSEHVATSGGPES
jgi:hypothetical protein